MSFRGLSQQKHQKELSRAFAVQARSTSSISYVQFFICPFIVNKNRCSNVWTHVTNFKSEWLNLRKSHKKLLQAPYTVPGQCVTPLGHKRKVTSTDPHPGTLPNLQAKNSHQSPHCVCVLKLKFRHQDNHVCDRCSLGASID